MPDGKWKVIGSPYQGYNSPGKILDGQISTFYSPNQGPKALQWVQVDFVDVVMASIRVTVSEQGGEYSK